jgi:hypothetical protein
MRQWHSRKGSFDKNHQQVWRNYFMGLRHLAGITTRRANDKIPHRTDEPDYSRRNDLIVDRSRSPYVLLVNCRSDDLHELQHHGRQRRAPVDQDGRKQIIWDSLPIWMFGHLLSATDVEYGLQRKMRFQGASGNLCRMPDEVSIRVGVVLRYLVWEGEREGEREGPSSCTRRFA